MKRKEAGKPKEWRRHYRGKTQGSRLGMAKWGRGNGHQRRSEGGVRVASSEYVSQGRSRMCRAGQRYVQGCALEREEGGELKGMVSGSVKWREVIG